ncbi:P-loop NTPase fold protein [Streptococcus sp. 20925_1_22]|uniref:P-loop NTPase fold protein n=2 Tax=Streptococcus TaxID=1301 RepID=UPI0028D85A83|nr:P-loop NTPase fold protein [uncultured Streptococcus sp.]
MDYITNAIDNYIDNPEPYALQIDGEWGSGKTYFINNYSKITTKARVIYFSVYGYNDLQNLKMELLSQLAIELDNFSIIERGNKITSIFRRINNNSNLVLNSISILSDVVLKKYIQSILAKNKNDKTILLVIDDLERLSKKIELHDFLGFIANDIIDKFNFKVLIISNETKMDNHEEFLKIREKFISKTIEFSKDEALLKEILQGIVTSDFLIDNLNWIIDIFSIFDDISKINIRTVLSIINNFEFIERKFKEQPSEFDEQYRNEYLKSVFLNVYVLTTELKSGYIKNEELKILGLHAFDRIFYIFGELDDKNYWHILISKYHRKNKLFDDYIIYSKGIMSYVVSGIWYDDNYRNKWYECFYPNGSIENYEKLNYFYNYSEKELLNIQEQLLNECYKPNITYEKVLDIYRRFSYFQTIDLLLIEKNKLEELILRITQLLSNANISIEEANRLRQDIIFEDTSSTNKNIKSLKAAIEEKLASHYSDNNLELIDAIFKEDYKKEKYIIENTPSEEIKVFESILSHNLLPTKIVAHNNKAFNLATFINSEYLRVSNSYEYHQDEIEDVKKMICEINNLSKNKTLDKVDSFKINHLLKKLYELLEHWQK